MKRILGISCSPRANGNTDDAVREALARVQQCRGVAADFIRIADFDLKPCLGCRQCMKLMSCAIKSDQFQALMDKMLGYDLYVLGSPVYWNSPCGMMKNFMDRTHGYYAWPQGVFRGKEAILISVATESGFEPHERILQSWLEHYEAAVLDKVRIYACNAGDFRSRPAEVAKIHRMVEKLNP
ncbi:MAG: flavodoxin family protein [Planctomycetes bacterium]|nr:flavodoxin family protein [Planctomycetota bacterium]